MFWKKGRHIAGLTNPNKRGAVLTVKLTTGVETVVGVTQIIERGNYLVFVSTGGGGALIAKDKFISAIPYD